MIRQLIACCAKCSCGIQATLTSLPLLADKSSEVIANKAVLAFKADLSMSSCKDLFWACRHAVLQSHRRYEWQDVSMSKVSEICSNCWFHATRSFVTRMSHSYAAMSQRKESDRAILLLHKDSWLQMLWATVHVKYSAIIENLPFPSQTDPASWSLCFSSAWL